VHARQLPTEMPDLVLDAGLQLVLILEQLQQLGGELAQRTRHEVHLFAFWLAGWNFKVT